MKNPKGIVVNDKNNPVILIRDTELIDVANPPPEHEIYAHSNSGALRHSFEVRAGGSLKGKSYLLSPDVNWQVVIDDMGCTCLVPLIKEV